MKSCLFILLWIACLLNLVPNAAADEKEVLKALYSIKAHTQMDNRNYETYARLVADAKSGLSALKKEGLQDSEFCRLAGFCVYSYNCALEVWRISRKSRHGENMKSVIFCWNIGNEYLDKGVSRLPMSKESFDALSLEFKRKRGEMNDKILQEMTSIGTPVLPK